jgi:16S rRNA (guanine527-N7)-methyltransferase
VSEPLREALAPIARFLPALTEEQATALTDHLDLLLRWNIRINLTAVRDFGEAARKHVGESLFLASHLPTDEASACDLGSGGGFPGIPLAILRPEWRVALVESDVRKSVFLREATRKLPNVEVLTVRFEQMGGDFDWLVSRAVNLAATRPGPTAKHAAVLGGASLGEKAGLIARYQWHNVAVPWGKAGFLWLGDVSRETSPPDQQCFT